jgi:membrane protease YdiL (CAAX protease family)
MLYDSTTVPPPPVPDAGPRAIAHWTHTLALLLFLALTAVFGHMRAAASSDSVSHGLRYTSTITLEWLLLGSVIAGIYHRRSFFVAAFANRERSVVQSIVLGVPVYLTGFLAVACAGAALYFTPLFHRHNEAVVLAMLPHSPLEFLAWFFVSLTAGVCEEMIFRGYLQQQFTAWTQRPILAVVLTGALFGCLHLYEGLAAIVPLALLGIVYGLVVRSLQGDLRSVIVAHTLQDFLVALIALARPWAERHQPHP